MTVTNSLPIPLPLQRSHSNPPQTLDSMEPKPAPITPLKLEFDEVDPVEPRPDLPPPDEKVGDGQGVEESGIVSEQIESGNCLSNEGEEKKGDQQEERDEMAGVIQSLDDDALIPRELLEKMDQASALHILGTKYNSMTQKHQEKYGALMKKYTEENAERKQLYNELVELKGNIRVFCRCRPLSSEEISKGCDTTFDFDPSRERELQIICSDTSKKHFKFDHVFGPQDNQETVFAETLPIVRSVLDGYNACIFAYGQTGTGKTFTMEGTEENRGVNYRTLEELFRLSNEKSSTVRYEFFVSMLEVYNEKIRDLLIESSDQQGKKLEIKQTQEGTHEIPGLIEAQAYSKDEVWGLLGTGNKNRAVGSTCANELSSRSHCLLRVTVKAENSLNGQRSRSHLWLVDLAGSERVGKVEMGERLKESQFINKSLSALGDVISGLALKNQHIPYRNSKLTHMLQSSLGGGCKTLMFVQISPSSADVGETICSLNFATRVQGIEQGPARKQADAVEGFKYKQMTDKLRHEEKESARLNENLQLMNLKYASRESVIKNLHEKVKYLESQLADGRRAIAQQCNDQVKPRRPPLVPIRERQPLQKTNNNLPPQKTFRRSSISMKSATIPSQDKENFSTNKFVDRHPQPHVKGQRVSMVPKRRASIATLPSQSFSKPQEIQHSNQDKGRHKFMKWGRLSIRPSLVAMAPQSFCTPDGKGSNIKYRTPQAGSWKSKIPMLVSPRQKLRFMPSPKNTSEHGPNKFCFSVQKRVLLGSPTQPQQQHPAFPRLASQISRFMPSPKKAAPQGLRMPMVGQTSGDVVHVCPGGARRVLVKNKRRLSAAI